MSGIPSNFVTLFVAGKPITQGSMKAFGKNIVHVKSKELNAWRDAIGWSAKRYFPKPLEGAVHLELIFILPKPKSVTRSEPHVKPDLDKLCRAVFDSLAGISYADDSQVVGLIARKKYGQSVGVSIKITRG